MADSLKVSIDDAKKEVKNLVRRFRSLQRNVVVNALLAAGQPGAQAAQAAAPRGKTGLLASRIKVKRLKKLPNTFATVGITPAFVGGKGKESRVKGKNPFYGLFLERGWWLTSHTPKHVSQFISAHGHRAFRNLKIGTVKSTRQRIRFVDATPFLKPSGNATTEQARKIFEARVFQGFNEIQSAGESAGII